MVRTFRQQWSLTLFRVRYDIATWKASMNIIYSPRPEHWPQTMCPSQQWGSTWRPNVEPSYRTVPKYNKKCDIMRIQTHESIKHSQTLWYTGGKHDQLYLCIMCISIQRSPLNLITDKVIILLIWYIFQAQNHFLCYIYNFDWLKWYVSVLKSC